MSPVSLVFYTEATVSINLKNALRVGKSIINCLTLAFDFYLLDNKEG